MSNESRRLTKRDLLSLAIVLIIAAVMRLGNIGVSQYRYDEAILSELAQNIVSGKHFPTVGLSTTTGIPWSPASAYIMAVPYAFSHSGLVATAYVALLNVIGVGLLWWLAWRFINPTVALLGGLAYALNPWAILTSRMIWTPDLNPPFVILAILIGCYAFIEGKKWAQIAAFPAFIVAAQIHPQGVALLPIYLWMLFIGRKKLFWFGLILSGILAAITLAPYLIGLTQIDASEQGAIDQLLSGEGRAFSINSGTFPLVAQYATGAGLETWVTHPRQYADLWAKVPPLTPLWFVLGGLTLIGIPAAWLRHRKMAVILWVWATLPLIVLTLSLTRLQVHYFIVSIPAFSLLAAVAVEWIASLFPQKIRDEITVGKAVAFGALGIILLTQGLWWRGLINYLDTDVTPNGFGTPLHYMMDVREQLIQYEDVVIIGGGNSTSSWIWRPMLNTLECVREVVLPEGGITVFPDKPFAALYPPDSAEHALSDTVRNLYQNDSPIVYPLRANENPYTVYTFETAPEWSGEAITTIEPARFDNGASLTGYHLENNTMYLQWTLDGNYPDRNYQYFGHFVDGNGERIGQRDTTFWPGKYWCGGDTVVTWINIELPPETAILRVGMYKLENGSFVSSNVIDTNSNPVSQSVDIPLRAD